MNINPQPGTVEPVSGLFSKETWVVLQKSVSQKKSPTDFFCLTIIYHCSKIKLPEIHIKSHSLTVHPPLHHLRYPQATPWFWLLNRHPYRVFYPLPLTNHCSTKNGLWIRVYFHVFPHVFIVFLFVLGLKSLTNVAFKCPWNNQSTPIS